MSADQASNSAERRPARQQLKRKFPVARVVEGVFALVGAVVTYWEFTSRDGFVTGLLTGYSALTAAAFALNANLKARIGLIAVGVLFAAAYFYHLSATR